MDLRPLFIKTYRFQKYIEGKYRLNSNFLPRRYLDSIGKGSNSKNNSNYFSHLQALCFPGEKTRLFLAQRLRLTRRLKPNPWKLFIPTPTNLFYGSLIWSSILFGYQEKSQPTNKVMMLTGIDRTDIKHQHQMCQEYWNYQTKNWQQI